MTSPHACRRPAQEPSRKPRMWVCLDCQRPTPRPPKCSACVESAAEQGERHTRFGGHL